MQQAQFKIGNGQFTSFSNADGRNAVPEPGTLALAGFGLAVMGVARRRRNGAVKADAKVA
ncbi:PEP-CTERM motif protein [compost metagenome]